MLASSSSPSSHNITDWVLTYTLSEPCDCMKITNSASINLITERIVGSKAERIKGFEIKFYDESNEQKIRREADRQAKRLADIIALKSKMRVIYNYAGVSKKIGTNPDKWTVEREYGFPSHMREPIEVLDLTDKSIASRIVKDDDVTHQLHHASIALGAEELQLYAHMFTELFQVIEEDDDIKKNAIPNYWKYSALRDALSHRPLDPTRAMKWVNQHYSPPDNFEFTPTNEFDYNSEKNLRQLKSEANNLKQYAMGYLNRKM
jgi:hypothetical protein